MYLRVAARQRRIGSPNARTVDTSLAFAARERSATWRKAHGAGAEFQIMFAVRVRSNARRSRTTMRRAATVSSVKIKRRRTLAMRIRKTRMATKKSGAAAGSQTPNKDVTTVPRSLAIAARGIESSRAYSELMSALMSDVISGALSPQVTNAICNEAGKLLKVVELTRHHGAMNRKRARCDGRH